MKRARLIAVVFLLWNAVSVVAQPVTMSDHDAYTINHYTQENGLPQNSVKGITVDAGGFTWLATESGLVRFDGQHFYTFNKGNAGISSTRIFAFQPDLNANKGRFYALTSINEYVGVQSALAAIDTSYFQMAMQRIPHKREHPVTTLVASGLPNYMVGEWKIDFYLILVPNAAGSYYVVQKDRVEFFSNWKKQWEVALKIDDPSHFFSQKGELFYLNTKTGFTIVTSTGEKAIELSGDILKDPLYESQYDELKVYWNNVSDQAFVLLGQKFYLLDKKEGPYFDTKLILNGFDLIANNIRAVHYEASERRLFLGSVTNGLYMFSKKQFLTLRAGNEDMDNIFYAQEALDSSTVLTPNGTILGLRTRPVVGSGSPVSVFKSKLEVMQRNGSYDTGNLLISSRGEIWSRAFSHLLKYNKAGDQLLQSWTLQDDIKSLYEGKKGRIWIGMKNSGLYYMDKNSAEPVPYPGQKKSEIGYILQPNEETLWLGTTKGLQLLNPKTGADELIGGTEKLNIRALYISDTAPDGIFLMTYEDGVFLYRNKKLVQFPIDANRYLGAAHCMVEDKKGFLWIPTNNGLFQVSRNDLLSYAAKTPAYRTSRDSLQSSAQGLFYMYYSKDQGFYTNEFNGGCQPCGVKLKSGFISLPSLNGLVWFDPETIIADSPDKELIVSQLSIRGVATAAVGDSVRLPLNPKRIEFHISVPFYGNLNNLRLSYAMVRNGRTPEVSDWVAIRSSDLVIRFSELAHGEYSLFIRKVNGFGLENYSTKKLLVIVPPNWYETWWFRSILGLVLIGGVYLYILFRVRYLQKRNQELEAQIERRTEKLRQTMLALQTSESELNRHMHIQTRLIASISHDVRTPLRFIIESSHRIENFVEQGEYGLIRRLSESITSSGTRMAQLLENTIGYIKTQVYGQKVGVQQVLLSPIIQEKADLFGPVIKEQNNRFINKVRTDVTVNTNAQLVGIVIHNLIDNANKYTYEGIITVNTEHREGKTHLIISDNGPGMPDHLVRWLNSPVPINVMETAPGDSKQYNGLGLLIVKEISVMINAPLFVENKKGTKVHLIFDTPSS